MLNNSNWCWKEHTTNTAYAQTYASYLVASESAQVVCVCSPS